MHIDIETYIHTCCMYLDLDTLEGALLAVVGARGDAVELLRH